MWCVLKIISFLVLALIFSFLPTSSTSEDGDDYWDVPKLEPPQPGTSPRNRDLESTSEKSLSTPTPIVHVNSSTGSSVILPHSEDLESHGSANNSNVVLKENETPESEGHKIDEGTKILTNRMSSLELGGGKHGIIFIEMEEPGLRNLQLKHYEMYESVGFYPAWTYAGFYPPKVWHQVNIYYFLHMGQRQNISISYLPIPVDGSLERHKSAMGLCTNTSLSVIKEVKYPFMSKLEQCQKTIQNECSSSLPSPIDIQPKLANVDPDLEDIDFSNYDHVYQFRMFLPDDGTDLLTMQFIPHENERRPGLNIGGRTLYLDRVLFRVGFTFETGSEHNIDGRQSGMELQFFFTPENITYWEALSQYQFMSYTDSRIGKNVHAVSVLVNVTKETMVDPTDAGVEYSKIFEVLSMGAEKFWRSRNPKYRRAIKFTKSLISLENIMRLPLRGPHYIYEGSMTHPPCLQHVIWTVFENPLWITFSQWKKFALVHSEYSDDKFLAGNFRPLTSIMVKVNTETYKQMRNLEGYEIEQIEIDRALNDRARLLQNEPILFSAAYHKHRKYFAMKVLKSSGSKDGKEFNYYELIGDTDDRGGATMRTGLLSLNLLALLIPFAIFVNNIETTYKIG